MNTQPTQPNFEKLKTLFYQAFVNTFQSEKGHFAVLMQSIKKMDFRSHYVKYEEFKKDFNIWLDRVDIRQSGTLIDVLIENDNKLPSWMKNKHYVIDYNQYDMLDLIPNNRS